MEENDERLLNEFIESRNLSLRTYQGYKDALKKYILFQNESFSNLLLEADLEEENRIRWKNRKLKQRLIDFRLFLYNNYMYNAAKVYFQRILTLYRHFEIEIPNLPKISNKSSKNYVITFEDLPTKEIIKNALEIANSVMRALILFIISSGCGRRESLNLTIDEHTGEAGFITRLEAFVDMLYRKKRANLLNRNIDDKISNVIENTSL